MMPEKLRDKGCGRDTTKWYRIEYIENVFVGKVDIAASLWDLLLLIQLTLASAL